jgi:hypothetical protein
VEDWSEPKTDKYGLKASTRFGLGILRSNAVVKMTHIKTTLNGQAFFFSYALRRDPSSFPIGLRVR